MQKKKGAFHHSSFLAGGATLAAGRLVAENGNLKVLLMHLMACALEYMAKIFALFLKCLHVDNCIRINSANACALLVHCLSQAWIKEEGWR